MTMPKNLIMVRHGYSKANEIQKQQDEGLSEEAVTIPDREWTLTDTGIEQAEAIGQIFQGGSEQRLSQIDAFYVSPYRRTMQTAAMMNIPKAHWKIMRNIRERSWGDIDTLPKKIFEEEYPRNYIRNKIDPLYWMPPSGESIAMVADNRVSNMLTRLHREHAGENVLMVTHHDYIQATRLVIEHITDDEFTQGVKDKSLDISNGSAIWYSRVNPETGELSSKITHMRIIVPEYRETKDGGEWVLNKGPWSAIERNKYSNQDLLELI